MADQEIDPLSVECPLCEQPPGTPCVSLIFPVAPHPAASHFVRKMRATNVSEILDYRDAEIHARIVS